MAFVPRPVSEALAGACFAPDYASARARFLAAAARAGARVDVFVNDLAAGPDGGSLSTDVAVLGPADAEAALLVVSGTHGPEGFVGSAAQVALLDALAGGAASPPVRIVLVHAINPFGFAHLSRTTENNVDLNRNFIDWSAGAPANPAYLALHDALCPSAWTPEALAAADSARLDWIARNGDSAFVDMTSRGQYSHPAGLNYGGSGPEWSNRTLEAVVRRHLSTARRIALIDWHTALGERGQPFFLCFNERGGPAWERACDWWGRDRVETTGGFGGAARPNYTGLLFHGVQRFAAHAELTGAVIEFGTVEMDDARLALQADRFLRFDAGAAPDALKAELRARVLEAFSPPSPDWRRSVLGHAIGIQHATLEGLAAWR
ncbi:M14 family metallopeptidase [Burkholderiaceae bacterium FT117]|uniref:DUF2817 domain-containing protein n=1 Tax=Zeimonas sediminis TaxID=2944268 RepID=UPI002343165C|nr:DUF2817 domain-containing protein [Zeimonas sediminis]MCM5572120.1 M14 family metallopeptidase [Zeimonas sediminis]